MNEDIVRAGGLGHLVELVKNKKCPMCKQPIKAEDFRDDFSIHEYKLSGLCQVCQDHFYDD